MFRDFEPTQKYLNKIQTCLERKNYFRIVENKHKKIVYRTPNVYTQTEKNKNIADYHTNTFSTKPSANP